MEYDEGVIKFDARHETEELNVRQFGPVVRDLIAWRAILVQTGLVGQDPKRYGGAGYGNVSGRVGAPSSPRGARPFLVSGTQTGGLSCVSLDDFALVERYRIASNQVDSRGLTPPSSEAMTHGAIYDLGSTIRFVFHGHCPAIWRFADSLNIPMTHPQIPYGTPAMAEEVGRLYRETPLASIQVLAMGGHEDGSIAFGRSGQEAGTHLMRVLADAYTLGVDPMSGAFCTPTVPR